MSEDGYRDLGELVAKVAEALRPPERLSVSESAEKYRYVYSPGSYTGPWRNSTTPYLKEPMDMLLSRRHSAVVFVGPAQCGKTDIIINWLSHTIICDPSDFIIYQTTQAMARDFSKRRVDRLHRHTEEVKKRLARRADADNTFDKFYTSGTMLTLSWPTINELSGRPVGRVALTDYDRMPENVDGEGSPFDLARKRTTTFGTFAMTLAESSPGYAIAATGHTPQSPHEAPPAPGIASLYNRGDRRRWYWPCVHCENYYEPSFHLLTWPDTTDPIEAGESAQMACPHCGGLMHPGIKKEVNNRGVWVPDGVRVDKSGNLIGEPARSDIASFWLKGPAAAFAEWKALVINAIKAEDEFIRTGSQEALRATVNTDQGEIYVARGSSSDRAPEDLQARAESIAEEPSVPAGVRFLTATIDVQGNRWEVQVHGVIAPPREGTEPDTIVIDRFPIIKSNRLDPEGERYWVKPASYLEDWAVLTEQVLNKSYPLADGSGRRMAIKQVGCDSGGKKGVTGLAYQYWRGLRKEGQGARFLLVRGDPTPKAPRIRLATPDSARKDRHAQARGDVPVLEINTNKIKDQLESMLGRTEPGGMVRFSDLLPSEFYQELTAETRDVRGRWQNPRGRRNEAWDLLVYHLALCSHLRLEMFNWQAPPAWAEVWDKNILVFSPEKTSAPEPDKKPRSAANLAKLLG